MADKNLFGLPFPLGGGGICCLEASGIAKLEWCRDQMKGVPAQNGLPAEIAEKLASIFDNDPCLVQACQCAVKNAFGIPISSFLEQLRDRPYFVLLMVIMLQNYSLCANCNAEGCLDVGTDYNNILWILNRLLDVPAQNGIPPKVAEVLSRIVSVQGYLIGCECAPRSAREMFRDEPFYLLLQIINLLNDEICLCQRPN